MGLRPLEIYVYTVRGSTLDVRIGRLQTSDSAAKVDPRAVRVNPYKYLLIKYFYIHKLERRRPTWLPRYITFKSI